MKKIILLFQMGSEVRQFGHSGFITQLLDNNWDVIAASRFSPQDFSPQLDIRLRWVKLPEVQHDFWYEQLAVTLDQAQMKRRKKAGLSTWTYQKVKSSNIRQRLRRYFISLLSDVLAQSADLFESVQNMEANLIQRKGREQYLEFLKLYQPDAIVTTIPRLNYQSYLLSAAEQAGIQRFLFFHTNKDIVTLSRLDHQFTAIGVWNRWMKEQLLLQNPALHEKTVGITGCAHFDCIGRADLLSSEIEFRTKLGIRKQEKLVLYTAAGPAALPEEERYINVVAEALKALPDIPTRLIVRLNPMDDSTHIENHLKEYQPEVLVLRPDWLYVRSQNLCYQKKEDLKVWNDLLHYSAVCVNIPSTVTVECALAGLPVINLGFDLPGPKPLPGSIRAFWKVDYYANARNAGAALLAENPDLLPGLLQRCLKDRQVLSLEQKKLIGLEFNHIYPSQAVCQYIQMIERCFAN